MKPAIHILGLTLIGVGLALYWPPLAYIYAGMLLVFATRDVLSAK